MTETRSNAFRYRHLLKRPAEGICLWYPSDDAAIGDVGYVYEGAFNALFNVFRPPEGLPGLPQPIGSPDLKVATLKNTHLAWMSLAQSGCYLHAAVPVDTTLINIGFTVQSQTGDAAFLVPGGESRRVETFYTVRQFERYLADNYTAIAERFSDHPNLDTLMILRGTTYTDGYCRGLLQQSHRKAAGMLTLSPLGLEMFSLEMGGNRSVIGHWLIQAESASPPNVSNPGYQHCIIIKPVIVRRRSKLRRLISTSFSIFNPDPARSRLTSATESDHTSPPSSGSAPSSPSSTTSAVSVASAVTRSQHALESSISVNDEVTEEESVRSDDPEDFSLIEDKDPRDDFEVILDAVLDSMPDRDMVIVDWDVLHTFWTLHGQECRVTKNIAKFKLEDDTMPADARIAYLQGISLLISDLNSWVPSWAKVTVKLAAISAAPRLSRHGHTLRVAESPLQNQASPVFKHSAFGGLSSRSDPQSTMPSLGLPNNSHPTTPSFSTQDHSRNGTHPIARQSASRRRPMKFDPLAAADKKPPAVVSPKANLDVVRPTEETPLRRSRQPALTFHRLRTSFDEDSDPYEDMDLFEVPRSSGRDAKRPIIPTNHGTEVKRGTNSFPCPNCGQIFTNMYSMYLHKEDCSGTEFQQLLNNTSTWTM